MKILFLYNQFLPEIHWNCLKAQEKNMGAIPPLNLCYVAAIARKFGHSVDLVDLQVEHYSFEELVSYIKEYAPDLLGFTITTYLFHPVFEWIKKIKKAVDIPVLVGGFHMSLYSYETMVHPEIDFAIIGNSEKALRDFFVSFGNIDAYAGIEGLCYKKEKKIYINNFKKEKQADLDALPFPARDLLKNDLYGNFICKKKNFTAMLTGIGCPFRCKYCASTLSQCLMRTPKNVVDEIEECFYKYGIREIDFYDQTFTIDKKRTLEICRGIIERKLKINWTIRTRTDLIDEELLEIMKEAGLYRIMYGVESGSQDILDRLNKKEKVEDIVRIVKATHKYGISVFGFFMLGCPGETKETLGMTRRLALSLPFDEIQVTRFTLFPGTEFYKEYLEKTGDKDYWSEYVLDQKNVKRLSLLDTSFTPQAIEKQVKSLYLAFYLRPRNLVRKVKNGELLKNYRKYFRAVLDMLFN